MRAWWFLGKDLLTGLILFFSLNVTAKTTLHLDGIKTLFLEKKVSEAIPLLKEAYRERSLSASQQHQIGEWLSAFQFDSTLGIFEKTREEVLTDADVQRAEKSFLQALEKEPFNSVLLSHYIGFLLTQDKKEQAKEKILWANAEMPYMEIYKVFTAWLDLKEGRTLSLNTYSCLAATLGSAEKEFCFYVKLLEKTRLSKSAKPTGEILALSQKTTLPNKHLILWKKWQNPDDKQKYLSSCQAMSGKQKKAYLFVPELCVYKEKEPLE